MRWLFFTGVTVLMLAVLVVQDPEAVGLQCGRGPAMASVEDEERVGPCSLRAVIDGDTIDVRCEGQDERVRLLRIDTPEREERGYMEARRALQRLLGQRTVDLVFEERDRPLRDRHGRLLAYVYVENANASLEMVSRGWSRFDRRFGPGRFARAFEAAEREAREAGRGLWPKPAE